MTRIRAALFALLLIGTIMSGSSAAHAQSDTTHHRRYDIDSTAYTAASGQYGLTMNCYNYRLKRWQHCHKRWVVYYAEGQSDGSWLYHAAVAKNATFVQAGYVYGDDGDAHMYTTYKWDMSPIAAEITVEVNGEQLTLQLKSMWVLARRPS